MVNVYFPEQEDDKNLRNQYFDYAKTGTLDVLGATLDETLYYNPLNAVDRILEQKLGKGTTGEMLTKDEWASSEYYREGIEVDDGGINTGLASLLAERQDERREFQTTLSRSRGGFKLGAAQFGTAIAGSFLDPLNIASAFIPSVATARFATMASRYGTNGSKLMTGVVDGVVGAAVVEPVVLAAASLEQDKDYGLMDSFLNVAIGGVLGGGINATTGGISSLGRKIRAKQEAKELQRLTAVERDQAGRISLSQVLNDDDTDLNALSAAAEKRTVASGADESGKKVVYQADGTPVVVDVVEVSKDGSISVRTEDGEVTTLDTDKLRSVSPFDENATFDMGDGDEPLTLTDLPDEAILSLEEQNNLDLQVNRESLDLGNEPPKNQNTLEANKVTIEAEKKRRAGQDVGRPQDPDISGADAKKIEKLKQERDAIFAEAERVQKEEGLDKPRITASSLTRLQQINDEIASLETKQEKAGDLVEPRGGELTGQQVQNAVDVASVEDDGLGRLGEYRDAVNEIEAEKQDIDEPNVAELEADNELLLSDLQSEEAQKILPADLKASITGADQLQAKADKYEELSRAGAACLTRNRGT